jgi:hypothetical protein
LVSKLLHEYTVPELYRSITFVSDERNLAELGVNSFLTRNSCYLKHVKELHFVACFHRHLRNRCPGGSGFDTSNDDDGGVHDKFFQALDSQLIPLFTLLVDDSLQKFRYVIPSCLESNPCVDLDTVVGIWGPVCLQPF